MRADAFVARVKVEGERDELVLKHQVRDWESRHKDELNRCQTEELEALNRQLSHYAARDAWGWKGPATRHAIIRIICCVEYSYPVISVPINLSKY